jgi:hypothetical protein
VCRPWLKATGYGEKIPESWLKSARDLIECDLSKLDCRLVIEHEPTLVGFRHKS